MLDLLASPLWILGAAPSPTPFVAVVAVGFVVGAFGHVIRSNTLIAAGILIIAVTTLLFQQQLSGA